MGEIDLGIHEHDVGAVVESGAAISGGGLDGIGGLDEDLDGILAEEGEAIVSRGGR